jgi:hypothetical protein
MDARVAHETIPFVCLGHIQIIMEAINELHGMLVSIVHPIVGPSALHDMVFYITRTITQHD